MTTAILYTRVSTSIQEREGTSLESQLAALKKYAHEHKYKCTHISDTHSGADLWDRPGISQARELICSGKAQVLIAYAIDRLSRDPVHLMILLEEASRFNARIEFVTEQMEDSPEWKLIQHVKAFAAQLEREKFRERSMRGRRQRLIQGKLPHASITLYGYALTPDRQRRIIFEPEAQVVRRIFDMTLSGFSRRSIVNTLNSEGIPPPSIGKRDYADRRSAIWGPTSIGRIITEPAYHGDARGWRWKHSKKKVTERPLEEQFRVSPDLCPPIVSTETWQAANEASKANRGTLTFNARNFALLRGIIRCARCNRVLSPSEDQYRCNSRKIAARYCGAGGVSRPGIENWVWNEIEAVLLDPEKMFATLFEADGSKETNADNRLSDATKRLGAIERGQDRILKTLAANDDGNVVRLAEKQLKEFAIERKRILALIEELKTASASSSDLRNRIEYLKNHFSQFKIPQNDEDRRQLLESLGVEVVAEKGSWSITIAGEPQSQHAGGRITSPRVFVARRAA